MILDGILQGPKVLKQWCVSDAARYSNGAVKFVAFVFFPQLDDYKNKSVQEDNLFFICLGHSSSRVFWKLLQTYSNGCWPTWGLYILFKIVCLSVLLLLLFLVIFLLHRILAQTPGTGTHLSLRSVSVTFCSINSYWNVILGSLCCADWLWQKFYGDLKTRW